ncbi:TIGR03013 family XrtA/PEP-CTERM system glycosyltransferase [Oceanicoccus sagamiensis]|uniref:UDP-phosphate galactose phosphotransferase n=1 Tax=Oceanicoccus sagamiensis TaxID=716816 RepID=A0A1X9NF60_9GAMM|nr:TIGR03013 family XrtA/PEP-CTERM system glycosyltransferase [Oceanicoccus sagamiensis]ARN74505.1 UDP-phosphate galactose phosphotransferase [Oceanicoccus sagamiensis]
MAHIQVFNHHVQLPYIFLSIVEFFVLGLTAYIGLAYSTLGVDLFFYSPSPQTTQYVLIYASVMLLSTYAMGVYGAGISEGFGSMFIRTVVSYCLLGAASLVLLSYVLIGLTESRGALFASATLSLLGVALVRWFFYSIVDASQLKRRILVLGAGQRAAKIIQRIEAEQFIGSEIIGFIPSDPDEPVVDRSLLLDPVAGLRELVERLEIDEILVAIDERRRDKGSFFPLQELLDCKLSGTRITEVVEFYEREFLRIELAEITTSWMLFRNQFRYSQSRDKTKRVFDIAISLALLFLVWPLMLLTAVAVFLETGAPIFYSQQRVGFKGKIFKIYKFRSMRQDAEKGGKAVWAQANDSRVTRVGAFIRNTRLDELPQLFNVIKGEMSFIGPRPERPEFVESLSKEIKLYDIRHRVKPGLMGWAQLKYSYGASVDDAANKLVYDLYYVKNHSILLDILIVVQSVEVILLGKGVR